MMAHMKTFINPSRARMAIAGLALIGLFCSGYLLYTYVTGTPIACAIVHGCDIVRLSRWATSFGLPRPLFGVVFYVLILASLIIRAAGHRHANFWRTMTRLAVLFGFFESGFLFVVQWIDIKAFCFWCLLSAIAVTVIMVIDQSDADAVLYRPAEEGRGELKFYLISLIIFLAAGSIGFLKLIGRF